ncbi:MAG: PorV/PorQ family protein [Bacteroidales bacterium]|nr:PorV/PorQ family protein [Bacteroidales bacterium]
MRNLYILLATAIILVGSQSKVFAQSAGFALISPDARTFALGGNSTAVVSNAFGFYNNSASLLFSQNRGAVLASYSSWLPNSTENSIIAGSGFFKMGEKAALSFGYMSFTHQEIGLSDELGNLIGNFTPKEFLLGAGFSYLIGANISASANVKYISSDIGGPEKGSAFAADLNFFYKRNSLNLGLSVSNLGSSIDYGHGSYSLPANAKVGAAYDKEISDLSSLLFTGEVGMLFSESAFIAGVGMEYAFKKMLFFRLGGHYGDEELSIPPYASVGVGANLFGVNIDLAYLMGKSDSPISNSLCVALGYNF